MAAHDSDKDFRRRRLSLPLSKMMDGVVENDETPTSSVSTAGGTTGTKLNEKAVDGATPPPPLPEDSSFRKRRLSLTNVSGHENSSSTATSSSAQQVVSPSPKKKKKPCRGGGGVVVVTTNKTTSAATAAASTTSITAGSSSIALGGSSSSSHHRPKPLSSSSLSLPQLLPSRILHSSELLLDDDEPDDIAHRPNNVFHHSSQLQQPRWKRRMTLDVISDADKLPFPSDVVGTYSYHGIEPAYDDGDVEEEEEEEDETAEDEGNDEGTQVHRLPTLQQLIENSTATGGSSFLFPAENTPEDGGRGGGGGDDDAIPGIVSAPSESIAKINQDRGGVVYPYANSSTTALFAVYDGHGQGGELVSQFALSEIQQRLGQHPLFRSNVTQAFADTFRAVDEALHYEPLIDPLFAGTTACVALLDRRTLYTANLGDSRAVCARRRRRCSSGGHASRGDSSSNDNNQNNDDDSSNSSVTYNYQAIDLTVDQNPDNPSEQRRIEAAGGHVTPPPGPGLSARVWLDAACTQVGLAMARSLGDHAAATVGVIADPVTTVHTIDPLDEFIILATDGVWEFISSQQAVDIVQGRIVDGATAACQALIKAAARRWQEEEGSYRDDITAIVVKLQCLWDCEEDSTTTT